MQHVNVDKIVHAKGMNMKWYRRASIWQAMEQCMGDKIKSGTALAMTTGVSDGPAY